MKIIGLVAGVVLAVFCLQHAEAYSMAFAWANEQNTPSYEPSTLYSYNAGNPITITWLSRGRYAVDFGRVVNGDAHVQVTMYGSRKGFCTVNSWGAGYVYVNCYNRPGRFANRKFTVLAIEGCGEDVELLSYAWLQDPTANSYTASAGYRFGDGTFAVTRTALGRYTVNIGSPANTEGAVLVSTYNSNSHCGVRRWGGGNVNLDCRNASLAYVDSRSTVMAIKAGFPHASFVWNSSGSGNISATWSHSSDGSAQTITRIAVGRYRVQIGPEANARGHIQVVAYNSQATCFVVNWGGGVVNIRCTRLAADYDSSFVALAIA